VSEATWVRDARLEAPTRPGLHCLAGKLRRPSSLFRPSATAGARRDRCCTAARHVYVRFVWCAARTKRSSLTTNRRSEVETCGWANVWLWKLCSVLLINGRADLPTPSPGNRASINLRHRSVQTLWSEVTALSWFRIRVSYGGQCHSVVWCRFTYKGGQGHTQSLQSSHSVPIMCFSSLSQTVSLRVSELSIAYMCRHMLVSVDYFSSQQQSHVPAWHSGRSIGQSGCPTLGTGSYVREFESRN